MSSKEMMKRESRTPEPVQEGPRYLPHADIYEGADELTLMLDVPGVDSKDIEIQLEKGVLSVYGKTPQRQAENIAYLNKEYEVGDYHRRFDVGDGVDTDRISAEHRDGVLTLHLPKAEKLRPKRIQVKAN